MMENKSRQTAQINLQQVKLDIIKRGWFVCEAPEEAPYDLAVDLGLDEKNERIWYTVQVKTDLRTTSRPSNGKGEPVSSNGKDRNSYYYYDKDITLLAPYDLKKETVIYIHKDYYKYLQPGQLKKVNEYNFPTNKNMTSYRKDALPNINPITVEEVSA